MPLPGNGILSLQGHSRPGDTVHSKPKQAMIVRMSAETLEELESFPNQPLMQFEFGENPGIYIGETFFPMRPLKEGTPHELYLRVPSAAKPMAPLKLCANVVGKFTVERELREKTQAQLRDRTREEEKLRKGHQTQWLETPPDLPATNGKKRKPPQASSMFRKPADHLRPNNVSATSNVSRPVSPLPPTQSSSSARDGVIPIRKRLIQCLAVSERTTDEVCKLVGGGDPDSSLRREFMNLLNDVAEQTAPAKKGGDTSTRPWRLKTQTWLEVRPYEWPRLSETERTNMARNARMAFKLLNIPESDPAWSHVKYRAAATAVPPAVANLSKGSANVGGPSKAGTAKAEAPKRGVLSKDAREKKAQAKTESARAKAEVLMKDESKVAPKVINTNASTSGKGKEVAGEAGTKGESISSTSVTKPPVRRGPGSGYRVSKSSSQDHSSRGGSASTDGPGSSATHRKPLDVQTKDREAPALQLPTKPAPSVLSTASNQEKKNAGPSTSVSRMKKLAEPAGGEIDSGRPLDKDRGGERERERRRGDEEKISDKARDKAETVAGTKRKKPTREFDDNVSSAQKRRRTDDDVLPSSTASSRDHEPRMRDLSLPKKPDGSTAHQRSKNQEPSSLAPQPMHTKGKREREGSPMPSSASGRPKAKREPSPLPLAAVSQPKISSGSSQRSDYQVERSTKVNGASSKTRRRSPIYTSSEDEGDIHQSAKHDTTSNPVPPVHTSHAHPHSRSHSHARPRPSLPARTDHAGLRARYSSSYLEYLASLHRVFAQRSKIENLLKTGDGGGSVESITDSDGDVELLDAEDLVKLTAEHQVLKDELEGIRRLFSRSGGGSSSD